MFDDVTMIDVAAVVGLTAVCLLTANILMGLLVSVRYDPKRQWPHRALPWPLVKIHNWTGYLAFCVVLLHPTLLLFAGSTPKFALGDILLPIHSPHQTIYNNLGAIAFYCLAFVVVTSYFRDKIGLRTWRKLHYVTYV